MPTHPQQPASGSAAKLQTLRPYQAISLYTRTTGVLLCIEQGRVWVTTDTPLDPTSKPNSADVVLHAGEQLALPAGAHVVVESWPMVPGEVTRFVWSAPLGWRLVDTWRALLDNMTSTIRFEQGNTA